jgi:hypothetical protein
MMDRHAQERLDTLDGARGRDTSKAAVRVEDIAALLQIPAKLKSAKAAGAAPTKAEFDALVEDVHALYNRLKEVHDALQQRVLR